MCECCKDIKGDNNTLLETKKLYLGYSPMFKSLWVVSFDKKGQTKELETIDINYCPMCGRDLREKK